MRVLDLFSGIGGFSLGLERTGGFQTVAFCEIDPFCRKVLAKHWPEVPCFEDITKLTKRGLDSIGRIDVICGGFPCQPVSCAGKRKGDKDARWLWPEFYRIICEVKPRWVLVENVPGLLSADSGRLFAGILRDLASSGYDAEWNIVSAASVGAPHLRKRVFIVAHAGKSRRQQISRGTSRDEATDERRASEENNEPQCNGQSGRERTLAHPNSESIGCGGGQMLSEATRARGGFCTEGDNPWSVEPDVGRVANGVPSRVDRLRALGNAIVPQCAEYVGRCILEAEARQ